MKPAVGKTSKIIMLAGAISLAFVATGFSVASFRLHAKPNGTLQGERKRILRLQMKRGVAGQVSLARSGASRQAVEVSVESVSSFIQRRSGLVLSEATKGRLVTLEAQALANPRNRLTQEELTNILYITASERLASLSDHEISRIRTTMDLGQNEISLRGNGLGSMDPAEFTDAVYAARDACRRQDATFRETLRQAISHEISDRFENFDDNASSHFGGIKRHGVTPLQAILIVYSVASDDPLAHSQETLEGQRQAVYGQMQGTKYVETTKSRTTPYGADGYRYATPLDIVMDESIMQKLLERFAERG